MELKARWNQLWESLSLEPTLADRWWMELEQAYSENGRHYHNLVHLQELFDLYDSYNHKLTQPHLVSLAIWYHDIVYNIIGAGKNEIKSAAFAKKKLQSSSLSTSDIDLVYHWIIATKTHQVDVYNDSLDLRYFLDFDLAILGTSREKYQAYANQIRKEYSIYPDLLYNPGRKKVLQQLLQQDLYLTKEFQELYETKAKENLNWEIQQL